MPVIKFFSVKSIRCARAALAPLLAVVLFSQYAYAQCCRITSATENETMLTCPDGSEVKVRTGEEKPAALVRLNGPFETSDYTGSYLETKTIAQVVGKASQSKRVELIAFMPPGANKVEWIVAYYKKGTKSVFVNTSLIDGGTQCSEVKGDLQLVDGMLPAGFSVETSSVTIASPSDVYARLGL